MTEQPARGLTEAEAARLLARAGAVRPRRRAARTRASSARTSSRSSTSILAVFGVLTLAFGDWRDALFLGDPRRELGDRDRPGGAREARARPARRARRADRDASSATARRASVAVDEVVAGDLVRVAAGDQVVADGELVASRGLRLDESILTGESRAGRARRRRRGALGLVRGRGRRARTSSRRSAPESYAERIAGEARAFRHPRSPLELALNRLLLDARRRDGAARARARLRALGARRRRSTRRSPTAVAAVVTLVPEGLILLASLTFAVAALAMARRGRARAAAERDRVARLGRRRLPRQDRHADRAGAARRRARSRPAGVDESELDDASSRRYAASAPSRNATLEAIAAAAPGGGAPSVEDVPFSSRRRWSGAAPGDEDYVARGARSCFPLGALAAAAEREAEAGRRVVAFGTSARHGVRRRRRPAAGRRPLGLVVLAERLRPDARETVDFFRAQGVELKVLSGDAPATVAAIARDAGIPRRRAARRARAARATAASSRRSLGERP